MVNFVYSTLWRLCILFIEIVQVFHRLLIHIKYIYRKSYDLLTGKSFNEVKYLEGCRKEWQKVPKHLLVVIGKEETLSSKVLSNLAVYALLSNIECISFYDTRRTSRFEPAKHIPKFIESRQLRSGLFLWTMVGEKNGCLKYKNGMDRSIEVSVLTENDSKPLIAEVCNELSESRDTPAVQEALKDPTKAKLTELMDNAIRKKLHNLPYPELVVIFNNYLCTFGALPWSTSFSEFHNIRKGNYTTVQDYTDVMYRYARCQQRFGK
ncbi:NUS1 family protein [Megaselia abdita]